MATAWNCGSSPPDGVSSISPFGKELGPTANSGILPGLVRLLFILPGSKGYRRISELKRTSYASSIHCRPYPAKELHTNVKQIPLLHLCSLSCGNGGQLCKTKPQIIAMIDCGGVNINFATIALGIPKIVPLRPRMTLPSYPGKELL